MSVYRVIELVGTSEVSWDDAAKNAVETAQELTRDSRRRSHEAGSQNRGWKACVPHSAQLVVQIHWRRVNIASAVSMTR